MNILGIHIGHLSTACLLKDGKIAGCVSEERFTGMKNQDGFPHQSVQWLLRENSLTITEIDLVVFPWRINPPLAAQMLHSKGLKHAVGLWEWLYGNIGRGIVSLPGAGDLYRFLYDHVYWQFRSKGNFPLKKLFEEYGGAPKCCINVEHHVAHAYSALFGVAQRGEDGWPLKTNVLTVDGEGDDVAATVGIWDGREYKRLACTPNHDSPGVLYSAVTEYFGMRPLEHEYKIMGMAPYVAEEWVERGESIFKEILDISGLEFKGKLPSRAYLPLLDKKLKRLRFDAIAGGIQRHTENLLCKWIINTASSTGINRFTAAGGVMMNVKANGKMAAMNEVEYLSVCPSSGDESLAIGAVYYGYLQNNPEKPPARIENIYLGIDCSRESARKAIDAKQKKGFNVEDIKGRETEVIAGLLLDGKIVGRCVGRCEFGARALGNRSILARTDKPHLVRKLNHQIKNRDFWMPFAGTMLSGKTSGFLKGVDKGYGEHMMIAYESELDKRDALASALHPYDYTMRPQVLPPEKNPGYANIIKQLEVKTGIPAILNTSLNLHGFPMVGGAEGAIKTFLDSGLEYIVIDTFLLSKNAV